MKSHKKTYYTLVVYKPRFLISYLPIHLKITWKKWENELQGKKKGSRTAVQLRNLPLFSFCSVQKNADYSGTWFYNSFTFIVSVIGRNQFYHFITLFFRKRLYTFRWEFGVSTIVTDALRKGVFSHFGYSIAPWWSRYAGHTMKFILNSGYSIMWQFGIKGFSHFVRPNIIYNTLKVTRCRMIWNFQICTYMFPSFSEVACTICVRSNIRG